MKKGFYRRRWHNIGEYTFLGNGNRSLHEQVLFALEFVQGFFTRLPQAGQGKKRGRLLRRAFPLLICLLFGFFLAAPAHAQNTIPARTRIVTAAKQAASAKDTCPTTNTDTLTGLPLPGSGTITGTNGTTTPCTVQLQTQCSVPVVPTSDWFFAGGKGLLFASPPENVPWGATLYNLALALLVIPIFLAGYQIMLGTTSTHYAGAVAILSRVVLIALLVVLLGSLIAAALQLESAIASALYTRIGGSIDSKTVVSADQWCVHVQNFFDDLYNLNIDQLLNAQQILTGSDYSKAVFTTNLNLINGLPDLLRTFLSILLAAQQLIRVTLLWFYIAISPLAVISASLPGESGKAVAWAWARGFLALLVVQLLQILILGLGSNLMPGNLTTGTDWFNSALATLLPTVIISVTLSIPRLLNASTTTMLSSISGSMGGAMSGVLLIVRGF